MTLYHEKIHMNLNNLQQPSFLAVLQKKILFLMVCQMPVTGAELYLEDGTVINNEAYFQSLDHGERLVLVGQGQTWCGGRRPQKQHL